MENKIIERIDSDDIKDLIYTIRGKQVMIDSDLAMLYQVETRVLNQAVKRNIKRFPEKFMFRLTDEENKFLISQIVISKKTNTRGGRQKLPYAFTEQGIAMLSSVLRSDIAIEISINIMDAFVEMRKFLINNYRFFERLTDVELSQIAYQKKTDERFDEVFDYIAKKKEVSQKIFFDGQIYDAFSLLSDIVSKATKSIVLIDNYVDYKTLDILCKKSDGVMITIYTHSDTKLHKTDINKFNKQYGNLIVKTTSQFHDRFMVLDDKKGYHIGASLKDAGRKTFAINEIIDNSIIRELLDKLK